ncbi:MAG: hypothetical protein EHM23_33360 [Acidobacteria bacterium]|nr:MAG: hypothetical protein EHM23_33360 [Acidobacteriota bacterium]
MQADKVMFEIYREAGYGQRFRVLYFTELNDHNRETEINRAMAGEHFYDGFIPNSQKDEAKAAIDDIICRLNSGEQIRPSELDQKLQPYLCS